MKLFRQVKHSKINGNIYLHSMPGLYESLEEGENELKTQNISLIFCLTKKSEIENYSPDYYQAVEKAQLGDVSIVYNPVPDYGIPDNESDLAKYQDTLGKAYMHLKSGNILVHCAGGIGRTGTFTVILLMMIGYTLNQAVRLTQVAGSESESPVQKNFCFKLQHW